MGESTGQNAALPERNQEKGLANLKDGPVSGRHTSAKLNFKNMQPQSKTAIVEAWNSRYRAEMDSSGMVVVKKLEPSGVEKLETTVSFEELVRFYLSHRR